MAKSPKSPERNPAHYIHAIALLSWLGADPDGAVSIDDDPDEKRRADRRVLNQVHCDTEGGSLDGDTIESAVALLNAARDLLWTASVDGPDPTGGAAGVSRESAERFAKAIRQVDRLGDILEPAARIEALEAEVARLTAHPLDIRPAPEGLRPELQWNREGVNLRSVAGRCAARVVPTVSGDVRVFDWTVTDAVEGVVSDGQALSEGAAVRAATNAFLHWLGHRPLAVPFLLRESAPVAEAFMAAPPEPPASEVPGLVEDGSTPHTANLPVGTILDVWGSTRVRLPDGWDIATGSSDAAPYGVGPTTGDYSPPRSGYLLVRLGDGTVPDSWLESHEEVAEIARAWRAARDPQAAEPERMGEPAPEPTPEPSEAAVTDPDEILF